jgi:hypothetical protein
MAVNAEFNDPATLTTRKEHPATIEQEALVGSRAGLDIYTE